MRAMNERIVVCALGGDIDPWLLPESRFVYRPWIGGGERTLYSLAAAAASLGYEVELRGALVASDLDEISSETGARPHTGMGPRRPDSDDLVLVPEGWTDPLAYARVAMSPARAVLLMLGPPGLMGWGFDDGWSLPDPLTVPLENVAPPGKYRAAAALGFELWTNTPAVAEDARSAGIECLDIGVGNPEPFPDLVDKTHDIALIESNRWASLAEEVAKRLAGVSLVRIPESGHDQILRLIGSARVLPWPSRIEGHSRIAGEARAMGTVPVALPNPFARGLTEEEGAVVVSSIEEMPAAVEKLLADPDRLAELSERAIRTGREQYDWGSFVEKVEGALAKPRPSDAGAKVRAAFGRAVEDYMIGADQVLPEIAEADDSLRSAYAALRRRAIEVRSAFADRVHEAKGEATDARRETDRAREEARDLRTQLDAKQAEVDRLLATKTFRYTAGLRSVYEWFRKRWGRE